MSLKFKFSHTDMVSIKSFYSSQMNFHTFKSQTLTENREMKSLPKLSSLQDKQTVNLHISTVAEITLPLLFIRSYINCFDLFALCKDQYMGHSRRLWTACNEI